MPPISLLRSLVASVSGAELAFLRANLPKKDFAIISAIREQKSEEPPKRTSGEGPGVSNAERVGNVRLAEKVLELLAQFHVSHSTQARYLAHIHRAGLLSRATKADKARDEYMLALAVAEQEEDFAAASKVLATLLSFRQTDPSTKAQWRHRLIHCQTQLDTISCFLRKSMEAEGILPMTGTERIQSAQALIAEIASIPPPTARIAIFHRSRALLGCHIILRDWDQCTAIARSVLDMLDGSPWLMRAVELHEALVTNTITLVALLTDRHAYPEARQELARVRDLFSSYHFQVPVRLRFRSTHVDLMELFHNGEHESFGRKADEMFEEFNALFEDNKESFYTFCVQVAVCMVEAGRFKAVMTWVGRAYAFRRQVNIPILLFVVAIVELCAVCLSGDLDRLSALVSSARYILRSRGLPALLFNPILSAFLTWPESPQATPDHAEAILRHLEASKEAPLLRQFLSYFDLAAWIKSQVNR